MAGRPDEPWQLLDFVEWLDRWAGMEDPGQDLRLVVAQWVMARHDNPYAGVKREPDFANLWFGGIQGTYDRLAGTGGHLLLLR